MRLRRSWKRIIYFNKSSNKSVELSRSVFPAFVHSFHFPGHFPYRPVMPGVMILEALAQAAGILAFKTAGVVPNEDTRFYFVGIDEARFRKPVEPGDQLVLKATLERALRGIWKFSTVAEVDGKEVASATMMVAPEVRS